MRCKLLATMFLLFALYCPAQNLEVFNPPTSSGPGYDDLFGTNNTNINILASPSVKGMTVFVPWGVIDTSSGPCHESSLSSPTCNWKNVDTQLWAYIQGTHNNGLASHSQKLNLIVEMIPEGGTANNQIPAYVFQPSTYTNWCTSCLASQPQDVVSCSAWSGSESAPTCSAGGTVPPAQPCPSSKIGVGVWNATTCRLTGSANGAVNNCPNQAEVGQDFSGYPVLYEAPIMAAFQKFVDTLLLHYSPQGDISSLGPSIGAHIGYIRIGLSSGGESFPVCAQALVNNATMGVWPSPQGLNYDLSTQGGPDPISPDWYQTSPTCPNGEASCQGKYAYIGGSPGGVTTDGPGYAATMFAAFQASRAKYATTQYNPQVVANAHSGPPNLTDMTYAEQEAQIFIGSTLPPGSCGKGYCGEAGFGQESLSEYDVWSKPINRPCDDDWCALFGFYSPTYPGNYYLQTTIPNLQAVYSIQSISIAQPYTQGLVTCASTCTNFNTNPPAFSPGGLYNEEGFAYTASNGTTNSYKVANNGKDNFGNPVGILSATQFTCDTLTPCTLGTNLTLYTGDYLPDTVPFASANHASTIEVYFCDWEFALNRSSNLTNTGCQAYDTTYSPKYATILSPPL